MAVRLNLRDCVPVAAELCAGMLANSEGPKTAEEAVELLDELVHILRNHSFESQSDQD